MYWEMESVFSVQCQASYITTLGVICIYTLFDLGVQHVLHHPELYIESDYEYSGQNYVNNMERQGRWADNVIIQMQIFPLSQL